ncbi:hypothetical protein [Mycobacterium sp. URHB0044]|jgi:hypothetical protein|uniref:hypothetical protein n=1 Tax=Mycobacterium sp. URHB0044 TaxID=1380386 RepID=UPI00055A1339|nr:hypothetical protein [Mycobacterium sp. URHB0044]
MGSARIAGDSDWDDQDLLSHGEAAERLRAEIVEIRARLIVWRDAQNVADGEMHARIRDEESRLLLIDERLVEIERTLRARGRSDPH